MCGRTFSCEKFSWVKWGKIALKIEPLSRKKIHPNFHKQTNKKFSKNSFFFEMLNVGGFLITSEKHKSKICQQLVSYTESAMC